MHMYLFLEKKYIETKLKLKQFQSVINLLFKAMSCAQPTYKNQFILMRINSYFQMKERAPGLTPNCNNIVMEKNAKRKTGRRQVVFRLTWGAFLWGDPRG